MDIHKGFEEHSVAEFFKKNRQMLGFSGKVRSMTMIVHEFVTNSLDACEEAGIVPEIFVQVEELENTNVRYCNTCKKKTSVKIEEGLDEHCSVCNGNYDIPKEFK